MFLLSCSFLYSAALANIEVGNVRLNMPPSAEGRQHSTSRHLRRLAKEDFKKTSQNFFDFQPYCEQLGDRYCDYGSHKLGSGSEFASWYERTQFVYTNMARTDHTAFSKAPYKAKYTCTPRTGLVPYYWSSELTQAARFHSHEMGKHDFVDHGTSPKNKDLFDGSTWAGDRIEKFWTGDGLSWAENVAAGQGSPLAVTKAWLESKGHCKQIFGHRLFMGVGYFFDKSTRWWNYWSQNFYGLSSTGPDLPKQDIVAGSHDTDDDTKQTRFLVQVHMSAAPTKVSVVIGGSTKTMSLLLGSAKSGTYYVDVDSLTGADKDGCAPYYFEVNSGASRMPADKAYHFLTYDGNKCKRNIGKGTAVSGPPGSSTTASGTDAMTVATGPPAPHKCTCRFGTPRTGVACTPAHPTMCASCKPGYTLSDNACTPTEATTKAPTQAITKATEATTKAPTQAITKATTKAPTQAITKATEATTKALTQASTKATEATTKAPTQASTKATTKAPTQATAASVDGANPHAVLGSVLTVSFATMLFV